MSRKIKYVLFDTDMFEVKVDTGCSYSMSGVESDFLKGIIVPVSTNTTVSAYSGAKVQITGKGTLKWVILDDRGRQIELIIPNSLYVKGTSTRLLSPQHYAQEYMRVHAREESKVLTVVRNDRIERYWGARKSRKTIQLDEANLGTLYSAPDFKNYRVFCTQLDSDEGDKFQNKCCYECTFDSGN
jgi:hypothetical protein